MRRFWGTGALSQISSQLQKEMPGLKGYSETSLKDMRTFYEQWQPLVNRQPVADELASGESLLPNNFSETIPDGRLAVQTMKAFKEEYLLDFINAEDLSKCIEDVE